MTQEAVAQEICLPDAPVSRLRARVGSIRNEAADVISLELVPADASVRFPPFRAGAHLNVHLPGGLVRSYSLGNSKSESGRYVIGVLKDRASRGGSRYLHERVAAGDVLDISAPRNNFPLDETAANTVLLAGGIGITPLYAMLQRLQDLGRPVRLVYCARNRLSAAFRGEIERRAAAGLRVFWHFDDEQGAAPDLKRLLAESGPDARYYCCGPAPMLDAFAAACGELGYRHGYMERFTGAAQADGATAEGYTVELRRSGAQVDVRPGKSLLDTLLDAGHAPDYGCKEGVCGACETRVIEGEIDHRDMLLGPEQKRRGKTMLICVSGCRSPRLVLDL